MKMVFFLFFFLSRLHTKEMAKAVGQNLWGA